MKKKLLLTLTLVACVLCCAVGLTGCVFGGGGDNGGGGGGGKDEVTSIHCSYSRLYFGMNGYEYYPVRLQIEDNFNHTLYDADVNWWSDNTDIATVDNSGLVTPNESAIGSTVIHAEYMKMEATCTVTVNGETDPNEKPGTGGDEPAPTTPTTPEVSSIYAFYDLIGEGTSYYTYDMAMRGNLGSTITLYKNNTFYYKFGAYYMKGSFTKSGDTITITVEENDISESSNGSTADYTIDGDKLIQARASMGFQPVFILRDDGPADSSGQLAGRNFVFSDFSTNSFDSSFAVAVRDAYTGAVIEFDADGTYVLTLVNEGGVIYQAGEYYCTADGTGYMTVEETVGSQFELVESAGAYSIEVADGELTMSFGDYMVFEYLLSE